MQRYWAILPMVVGLSGPAMAAEYLTSVSSEVYQTTGTPKEIATRANTCISQHLAAGTTDAPLIVSSDLDGGIIVARSALKYPDGLLQWEVRSIFTFEAREGRFKIEQTKLERFNNRWDGIGKWKFSGWTKAEAAFKSSADAVARCVISGPNRDDW